MRGLLRLFVLAVTLAFPSLATTTYGATTYETTYQRPLVKCASCQIIQIRIEALRNDVRISQDYIACAQSAIDWLKYRGSWQYQVLYDAYLTRDELSDMVKLIVDYEQHIKDEQAYIVQCMRDIVSLNRIANVCRDCPIPQLVAFPN